MALPKATSQGSKGAGGGAFNAFRGMSAAQATPDTIAKIKLKLKRVMFFNATPPYVKSQPQGTDSPSE